MLICTVDISFYRWIKAVEWSTSQGNSEAVARPVRPNPLVRPNVGSTATSFYGLDATLGSVLGTEVGSAELMGSAELSFWPRTTPVHRLCFLGLLVDMSMCSSVDLAHGMTWRESTWLPRSSHRHR